MSNSAALFSLRLNRREDRKRLEHERLSSLATKEAASAAEALEVIDSRWAFDLLFTDVVMPGGMNGKQLADAALLRQPGLKVLFTSGYTEDAIVHQGRLDPGVNLLSKPYRRADLVAKIRLVLDGSAYMAHRPATDA